MLEIAKYICNSVFQSPTWTYNKYRCVCTSVLGVDVAYTGSERSHLNYLCFIIYGSNFSTPLRLPFRITHKQSLLAPTVRWGTGGGGVPGLAISDEEIATSTHNKTQIIQMSSLASCVCNIKPKYKCAYTSVLVATILVEHE